MNHRMSRKARLLAPACELLNAARTANPGFWWLIAGVGLISFAGAFLGATWLGL